MKEIKTKEGIKRESKQSLCGMAIFLIISIYALLIEKNNFAIIFLILGLYAATNKRYWDIRKHIFEMKEKLEDK